MSVIIPARDEASGIGAVVEAARRQAGEAILEILVVDDGSRDDTARRARDAGARVLVREGTGNPGAARNEGARSARGRVLLFLDADCLPRPGWLAAHREAHARGETMVGGVFAAPRGMPWTARADYYLTAYHAHPGSPGSAVPNHSPANFSVRRDVFDAAGGFTERFPVADGHEELAWQAAAIRGGARIWREPAAIVEHRNRPGLGNLLRRSFRWGYSATEAKVTSRASRAPWNRSAGAVLLLAYPLAFVETVYIVLMWVRASRAEALIFLPVILAARLVYASAQVAGTLAWKLRRAEGEGGRSPWR